MKSFRQQFCGHMNSRVIPFSSTLAFAVIALSACGGSGSSPDRQVVQGGSDSAHTLIDVAAIDSSVSPCDDFYQYACGNWIKSFKLPADQTSFTKSFNAIYNRNLEIEKSLLEGFAQGASSVPAKYAVKLGQFYSACMNTDLIEQESPQAVARAFSDIDLLTKKESLAETVAHLQRQGINAFFAFGPDSDAKDSNKLLAEFSQGGMGLPNQSYYLDASNSDARAHYLTHVSKMFQLAGFSDQKSRSAAAVVMKIETQLAKSALPVEDLSDPQKLYHPSDFAGVRAQLSGFRVDTFLAVLGLRGVRYFNVTEPQFLHAVTTLISDTSLDDLKVYLKWHSLRALGPHLGEAFRAEHFDFNGAYMNGAKQNSPRWKQCVRATEDAMGEALGEAYVNQTFGEEGKKRTLQMITQIREAFRANLASVEWLDAVTRQKAEQKLNQVLPKIGYPDHYRNFDALDVGTSFISNVLSGSMYESAYQLNMIGKPVDKSTWAMFPQTVNAYYNPSWNEIVFPAGILQSPFFSKDATDGANFGAIGMVMGHELTHGFDSSGRQYDGDGNLVDWWTKQASNAFDAKSSCMIDQYSHYEVVPGVFLNGKQTITENIADLGGIKLSFGAFKKVASTRPAMAAVDGFDEAHQFFLAFAQSWCTVQTPEVAKFHALTDQHSDPKSRVNGPLVDTQAFAETFGCTQGSPMAPKKHCSLW